MSDLIDSLDLNLAVKRVKCDMRDDWFVDPLRYNDILKPSIVREWFNACEGFKESEEFNIPKEGFVLREAREVLIFERVLYQALIDVLIEKFDDLLDISVFSYRLRPGRKNYLFLNTIDAWKGFIEKTKILMDKPSKVLVVTDIQNYYQCIRVDTLCDGLLKLNHDGEDLVNHVIEELRKLLKAWEPSGIGIPQNRDPSSFLGNMYLQGVDAAMVKDYRYMRYMDDVHIVCDNEYEARKALRDFILKLRPLELSVNGAKTKFVTLEHKDYPEIVPANDMILEQIDELFKEKHVRSVRKAIPLLEEYTQQLMKEKKTKSKAFRFCINRIERLARCNDITFDAKNYVDIAIELLVMQPWSSEMLVRLLRSAKALTKAQIKEIRMLVACDKRNIYEWQSYLLWQLAAVLKEDDKSDELLSVALESIKGGRSVPYQAGAALYLGKCGSAKERLAVLRLCKRHQSNMLLRSVAISTQEVAGTTAIRERKRVVPAHYVDSLDSVPKSGVGLQYFLPLPQINAADIYDDLPGFYF